jgi:DNA-binding MarR family transcriptional regulator
MNDAMTGAGDPAPSGAGARAELTRAELTAALDLAGREVSAATVAYHSALAGQRGLTAIEEKALDILLRDGPLTHAALAERLQLARASVTNLTDRLAAKGYVRRERNPADGRSVFIAANAERITAELTPLFAGWTAALHELYDRYSPGQLATILDFLRRAAALQQQAAAELGPPPG